MQMRSLLSASITVAACFSLFATENSSPEPPKVFYARDIKVGNATVLGQLPYPLGTPVEIECIVEEHLWQPKPYQNTRFVRYQLGVYKVNDVELSSPISMRFEVPMATTAWVARDEHDLGKLVHSLHTGGIGIVYDPILGGGMRVKPISPDEAEQFRASYVGSKHHIVVYEAGSFKGIVGKVPEDFVSVSPPSFSFSTHLVVIGERRFPPLDIMDVLLTEAETQRYIEFIKVKWNLLTVPPVGIGVEYFEDRFAQLRDTRWMDRSWFEGWESLLDRCLIAAVPDEKRELDRQLMERFGFTRIASDPEGATRRVLKRGHIKTIEELAIVRNLIANQGNIEALGVETYDQLARLLDTKEAEGME